MKLLLDQDVYAVTARFLNDLGYDVVPVARIGLSQAKDQEILNEAQEQSHILVTRDRDFGRRSRWTQNPATSNEIPFP